MPNTRFDNDTTLPPRHLAPLQRSELRRERVRVATSKRWLAILLLPLIIGGALASFLFHIPPSYVLTAIILILAVLWIIRYQSSTPKKRREITEILISEANRAENEKLVAAMRQLSSEGFDGYAITLGKFLQHKRNIEAALQQRSADSPQENQVAELVIAGPVHAEVVFAVAIAAGGARQGPHQ